MRYIDAKITSIEGSSVFISWRTNEQGQPWLEPKSHTVEDPAILLDAVLLKEWLEKRIVGYNAGFEVEELAAQAVTVPSEVSETFINTPLSQIDV